MNGNPHLRRFEAWRDRCRYWLRLERGRNSALARHLGVRRQTVWRWFNQPGSSVPGWAAVATNIYYYNHVPPQADTDLQERQQLGPLIVPSDFVRRSADKVEAVA